MAVAVYGQVAVTLTPETTLPENAQVCPGATFQYNCVGRIEDIVIRWSRCMTVNASCIDFASVSGRSNQQSPIPIDGSIPGLELTLDSFSRNGSLSVFESTLTVNVSEFDYSQNLIIRCGDLREQSDPVLIDFTIKCMSWHEALQKK